MMLLLALVNNSQALAGLISSTSEADPEGGEGGSSPGQILNSLIF